MISNKINDVITNGMGHIGCVSSSLKPYHADTLANLFDKQKNEITCCLNEVSCKPFLNHVSNGSRVSLFVAVPSHEAYNIKGSIVTLRNVTEDEKSACDLLREKVYGFYEELGIPEHLADRYWLKEPDIAVVFAVEKIFVQTPGPDAGKQV